MKIGKLSWKDTLFRIVHLIWEICEERENLLIILTWVLRFSWKKKKSWRQYNQENGQQISANVLRSYWGQREWHWAPSQSKYFEADETKFQINRKSINKHTKKQLESLNNLNRDTCIFISCFAALFFQRENEFKSTFKKPTHILIRHLQYLVQSSSYWLYN